MRAVCTTTKPQTTLFCQWGLFSEDGRTKNVYQLVRRTTKQKIALFSRSGLCTESNPLLANHYTAVDRKQHNCHQAIIQKIADERRRRAEEACLPFPRSPSSVESSTSVVQSSPIAVDSSATSQSSLPIHHHQQQQHQQGLSSSLRNLNTSSRGAASYSSPVPEHDDDRTAGGGAAAAAGYRGQSAWEQRLGRQQAVSETPAASSYDVYADEFPFPDTQGRAYNGGGEDGRRGQRNVEVENDGSGASSGRGGGGSTQGKDGASSRPAAVAVTQRSSPSAEKGTCRLSRSGSGSYSHSHERLHMHTFSSRRGSSSSFGSPDRGPSSPGWSTHARRLSGVDAVDAGGPERGGADRNYQAAPGSASAPGRHLTQKKEDNLGRVPLREAWAQEGAGGEAQGSSYGPPSTQLRAAGVAAAKGQEPEFNAAGRKDWVESVGALGEEGARREVPGGQERGEWKWSGSSGLGGGGQQQAGQRMVDEDAYRFRSFSEEVKIVRR